jgi:hypothetical protein
MSSTRFPVGRTEAPQKTYAEMAYAYLPDVFKPEQEHTAPVKKVHEVFSFLIRFVVYNYNWVRTTTGAKAVYIKMPEAVVKISNHWNESTAFYARPIHFAASYIKPVIAGLGCAKPFIAFLDARNKFEWNDEKKNPTHIDYLAVRKGKKETYERAYFTFSPLEWYSNYARNVADWVVSVSEVEAFLRASYNPGVDPRESSYSAPFASIAGSFMWTQTLAIEANFLIQTLWFKNMHNVSSEDEQSGVKEVVEPTIRVAALTIVGSALKIALAVTGLTLDLFNYIGSKEHKPAWLATARFWIGLAPNFLIPAAFYYWPKVVIEPLMVSTYHEH